MDLTDLLHAQRKYFEEGNSLSLSKRLEALKRLQEAIREREPLIQKTLYLDLNKSKTEAYMTEVGMVLEELRFAIRHLASWSKARKVATPLAQFPSKSYRIPEPYGVVLIMSPWNYPFQLTLSPLIGALAAGNCAVLKPSNYSPHTSQLIQELISSCFPPEYVCVVPGGREKNSALLKQKFDYIFFTGGVSVGKLVMQSAARHLTPVTLELGGKSPCLVDHTADLSLAARRIVFGKFLNAGQTCVAPDYILVEKAVKIPLLAALQNAISQFYGRNALYNPDYPKIINAKHFNRLQGLLAGQTVFCGGKSRPDALKIEPTVLEDVSPESAAMREEIFGPLLPVLTLDSIDEMISFVRRRPKPLARYLFTSSQNTKRRVLRTLSFGGGCVNDTIIHLASTRLPFGGVGESGMGSYHGKKSFDTFTHYKSIVKKATWLDLPMRYPPYTDKKLQVIRKFLK